MIFSMFIGAQLFSYFLNTTRAPQAIGQYMANLQVPPSVIIIGIMAIYFIYGCVMGSIFCKAKAQQGTGGFDSRHIHQNNNSKGGS